MSLRAVSVQPAGGPATFNPLTTTGLFTEAAEDSITARAGGGKGSATALSATVNLHRISVCATAGDSVLMPAALAGQAHFLRNDGVAASQVFGAGSDTINGVATGTGVSLAAGSGTWLSCETSGNWTTSWTAIANVAGLGAGVATALAIAPLATGGVLKEGSAIGATTPAAITGTALTGTSALVTGDTWANVVATTPTAGTIRYATNVGATGTYWTYRGSRWAPFNGSAILQTLGGTVTGIVNSETLVFQTLLPINVWQINDNIRLWYTPTKSGTTDTSALRIRIGTAGTTADTQVVSTTVLAAASLTGGGIIDLKLTPDAVTVVRVGAPSGVTSYVNSASAPFTPVTITSAASNALYVSVFLLSSSTNDTVGMQSGQLQFVTP